MTTILDAEATEEAEKTPRVTAARPRRVVTLGIILVLVVALVSILAVMIGQTAISAGEVIDILLTGGDDRVKNVVVTEVRLPRMLVGLLAGAALGVSGVMLQDALGNPLAEPALLGVSAGGALAVAAIVVFAVPIPAGTLPFFALIGGLVAGAIIIGATRLTSDPIRMILIGAALGAFFSALITTVIVLADPDNLRRLTRFLIGSIIGRDWRHVRIMLPWIAVGLPVGMVFGRTLNLLQLGDELAEGLGLNVVRARTAIFVVAIALNAAVISVCGPVGFVALVAPHLARGLLATTDSRQVLPIAALLGAALVVGADLLAREVLRPAELPVGVFTTLVGAPMALYVLRRIRVGQTVG
ncbi:MAG: iron ABC transporter permease [Actinomycetota bacterium]